MVEERALDGTAVDRRGGDVPGDGAAGCLLGWHAAGEHHPAADDHADHGTATFTLDGGPATPVPGSTTTDGPATTFTVVRAHPVLTNPYD